MIDSPYYCIQISLIIHLRGQSNGPNQRLGKIRFIQAIKFSLIDHILMPSKYSTVLRTTYCVTD